MELTDSIKAAWTAVEDAGVPQQVQELAFREALRSLLSTAQPAHSDRSTPAAAVGTRATTEPNPKGTEGNEGGGTPSIVNEQAVIAAVSEHTGVATEKLEEVFHIDNGAVRISLNHTALGKNAAEKSRTTAQIITIIRKIGMGQTDTDFDVIREECQRKHFYDSKNFASAHLPGIDGFVAKGEGRNKRLEARASGINAFPDLIEKALGNS